MKTLWEIMSEENPSAVYCPQTVDKAQEKQNHSFDTKQYFQIGNKISIIRDSLEEEIYPIDDVLVYETNVGSHLFYHTDYCFADQRIRIENDPSGHKIYLYYTYSKEKWSDEFYTESLCNKSGEIDLYQDETGVDLETPWTYWRINDILHPYHAKIISNQSIDVTYWDYHRLTDGYGGTKIEYLIVEMDNSSKNFTLFLGNTIPSYQICCLF